MLRGLYSSATGMKAQELLIDVTANNLANVNTNGFKRSQLDFADQLYSTIQQAGSEVNAGQPAPVGLQIGSGVRPTGTTKLFKPGSHNMTGNALDAAISGDGFFQIELANGDLRYTRDGAFRQNPEGQLVTMDGNLLSPQVSIPALSTRISIGKDGTISFMDSSGVAGSTGPIQLARFSNPAGLSSEGGNLYAQTIASGDPQIGQPGTSGAGTLVGGHLESSNVEVVQELISLITAQRAYDLSSKVISASDEMMAAVAQLR